MATFTKFQPFVEALAEKAHNLGSDTLKVAFCSTANAPAATDGTLSDLTTATTNADTVTITVSASSQTSGTYKLVCTDLVITATAGGIGPFQYVVIYNDTATNDELVAFFDYGSEITVAEGETFTLDFDATNGLLQLV